ncbi:MAG: ATP synthase F1 subunit delta [Saprospiraceae bacterium]|nr:ATP synthase F1 subunit delta [Saprospiraceae bacterium]
MSVQRIASRYAKSLLDLAVEQNKLERVLEDVNSFREVLKNREFKLLTKSPIVSTSKKKDIFKALFEGKYDELTMAFLNILLTKGRESYLSDIAVEFLSQYKKLKHISTVRLITAAPLSDEALASIKRKLLDSTVTDDKVEISVEVDPELIGGFIIEFEDNIYDASVANKLDELKKGFRDNKYISMIMAR